MKYILLLCLFTIFTAYSQSTLPKREFRAAWFTTVGGSDWPSSSQTPDQQKNNMIELFDSLKRWGMNVIIMQVRSECDAMYKSDIEPWSIYLTGTQGKAPNPYYDPLEFAVQEAHKRGMELHAWFNPYRVKSGTFGAAVNYITNTHPDWILTIEGGKILDPGRQAVRDHVISVICDVTRRYDIDGVHMDDFFYPYPSPAGITTQDDSTFIKYPRGFTNKSDWRRDNVNLLIKGINDSVHAIKRNIKFGMSPFGIWKSGVPAGITGLSAYSTIYCDAIAWLQKRAVDYITPQLYWAIGGSQDYVKLSAWWADSAAANGRHFYPGLAAYRISEFSASEIPNQIRINRANPKTQGDVFFRVGSIYTNPKGFADSLRNSLQRYPALTPSMTWRDAVPPNAPRNFRFARVPGKGYAAFQWDLPVSASDGDSANMYVIYKSAISPITPADLNNTANIFDMTSVRVYSSAKVLAAPQYFVVTALDKNSNESAMSSQIEIPPPSLPALALPANGSANQRDTLLLRWNYAAGAGAYILQVSTDSMFTTMLVNQDNISDTAFSVASVVGQQKYFWRVRAKNPVGASQFSQVFSFTTGFPSIAFLAEPPKSASGVAVSPVLKWFREPNATAYRVQFANGVISPSTMIFDSSGIADTSLQLPNLVNGQAYFWRVRALNQFGAGEWSAQWGFRVIPSAVKLAASGIPESMQLPQNYPNPFNPQTTIEYAVPQTGHVTLNVYSVNGRLIRTLVSEEQEPGYYSIDFDAGELSSGVYFYQLTSGGKTINNKMILLR